MLRLGSYHESLLSAELTLGKQGAKPFHVEPSMWRIRCRRNLSNKHTTNLRLLLSLLRPLSISSDNYSLSYIKRHYQPIFGNSANIAEIESLRKHALDNL